ncbi:hypothetical protein D3C75_1132960 [compost metagenome]
MISTQYTENASEAGSAEQYKRSIAAGGEETQAFDPVENVVCITDAEIAGINSASSPVVFFRIYGEPRISLRNMNLSFHFQSS